MYIINYNSETGEEKKIIPEFSTFPDGQPHVKLPKLGLNSATIHCSIRNPDELFKFLMVADVCFNLVPTQANIYWLFGARMDRRIDLYQPSTFDLILNSLDTFSENIYLLDIHNPNVAFGYNHLDIKPIVDKTRNNFDPKCDIYFPDAGAESRYKNLFDDSTNVLVGQKKRDSQTGKLSGFELKEGQKGESDSILIVDDLIDAGGTFLGQFPVLKALGYERIALYTTHGLYTKGFGNFNEFDSLYYTNSFQFWHDEHNTVLKLNIYTPSTRQENSIVL